MSVVSIERCFKEYVVPFEKVEWHYDVGRGFIAWRLGTGLNVELLHVRAFELRKGHGRRLVYWMLNHMARPYCTVFGFTRVSNERAAGFYQALGFNLQTVQGLYADGEAVMFWQTYQELLRHKEKHERLVRGQA